MTKKVGKLVFPVLILAMALSVQVSTWAAQNETPQKETERDSEMGIYDFEVESITGEMIKLKEYEGKVILIVNVASRCGFTPQYTGLQEIYTKYKDKGFVVLGFPANNFLKQEPGTNQEILEFCSMKFHVTFPMFAKISVKGEDIHPLYKYLTSEETDPEFSGDITWNFNKFLINKEGKISARFGSRDKPESEKIIGEIESLLEE